MPGEMHVSYPGGVACKTRAWALMSMEVWLFYVPVCE